MFANNYNFFAIVTCTGSAIMFIFKLDKYFLFAFYQSKKVHNTYSKLGKIVDEVATLQVQLKWLEEANFSSQLHSTIQSNISNNNTTKASLQILYLKQILDRFDARLNVFLFFF